MEGGSQVMGQLVDLTRGSVTLMTGKLLGDAEQNKDVPWLLFPHECSGLCVENGPQGKQAELRAACSRVCQ